MVILETAIRRSILYSEITFEGYQFSPDLRRDDERDQISHKVRNLEISVDPGPARDRTGTYFLQRQSADIFSNHIYNAIDDGSADIVVHFASCHHSGIGAAPTISSGLVTDSAPNPDANNLEAASIC